MATAGEDKRSGQGERSPECGLIIFLFSFYRAWPAAKAGRRENTAHQHNAKTADGLGGAETSIPSVSKVVSIASVIASSELMVCRADY